jgi:hypothetical protein
MTGEPARDDRSKDGKNGLSEERKWELAVASLRRAEESTNYLRILMFVAAGGLVLFTLPEMKPALPRAALAAHVAALLLAALAICLLFYGWHVQRAKARERFNYLRDGDYDAYVQYDKAVETISAKRDSRLDFLAFVVLLAAFAAELFARCLMLNAAVPPIPVPGVHV